MPLNPTTVFGRLELHYTAYGKPHVYRVYVDEFGTDPAVGTFTATGTPASLDALATELTSVIGGMYQSGAGLTFGEWIGEKHVGSGVSFVPINNGTITPGTITPYPTVGSQPGAPSQATWNFRDTSGKLLRQEFFGNVYVDSTVFRYGGLGGPFLVYANYMLGSIRVRSKGANPIAAMVSLTFDTNDGLTRRYRR